MAEVETKQGRLRGAICNVGNDKYYSFKGIPYAKPPVGLLRFKAPQPPEAWQGVRDALEHGPVCPQYNERLDRMETGSEDCLYLNVYSKNVQPASPLPVMVWIHGGSFYTGSGNSDYYGPEFFMEHNIILVTFNYRLEVLGFLCLDNEEVPGNAGLKDQVAALKWVKENISAFGGDSNNITIFGCSAGSASTSCHLVSTMSEGLFNKAICQSGVCLNEWSYNLYARERAFQLGKLLNIDTEDPSELLKQLMNVPTMSLVNIKLPSLNIDSQYRDITDSILFGPVIEKSDLKSEKFLSEPPPDLVKSGKVANVPIILGYTSGEGIEIGRNLQHLLGFLSTVGSVVPRELKYKLRPDQIKEIDNKVRQHYFQSKDIDINMMLEAVNMETDKLFAYNIYRFARYHNLHTRKPVYLYKFMAETERNYTKRLYKMDNISGVCHADELNYLFNVTCIDIPLSEESIDIIKQFIQLWVDFVSTGNPTSSSTTEVWKPFTDKERNCLLIDKHIKCVCDPDAAGIRFWEEIYGESNLSVNS